MLLSDATGVVRYANSAVAQLLGAHVEVVGRLEQAVLAGVHNVYVNHLELPDGWKAAYLESAADSDARFLADVGAGLTGMLNLNRILGHLASLAVPRLGSWCAIRVGDRLCTRGAPRRPEHRDVPGAPVPGLGRTVWSEVADLVALGADAATAAALLAGGPVYTASVALRAAGEDLGTFTIARTGSDFPLPDLVLVEEVARRSAAAVGAARVYDERTQLARTLRNALIPPTLPSVPGLEVGARYRPAAEATEIGGDFYQVYRVPAGGWAFEIGDVCGKGVEAAVLTGQVRQSLRTAVLVESDPAQALALVNGAMIEIDGTRFVTLIHGRLEAQDDGSVLVRVSNGGHPRPLVLRRDGTVEPVDTGGTIVGMLAQARFRTATLRLAPGETLLLYTDGVTEATVRGELLGEARLVAMLGACGGMPAQATTERLEQMVLEYLGGGAHDDIALLAIRAEEGA
ncbi:MAG: PP2C family protein-serine/threonine phosphatase [Sporichthyaceae bacterium]